MMLWNDPAPAHEPFSGLAPTLISKFLSPPSTHARAFLSVCVRVMDSYPVWQEEEAASLEDCLEEGVFPSACWERPTQALPLQDPGRTHGLLLPAQPCL